MCLCNKVPVRHGQIRLSQLSCSIPTAISVLVFILRLTLHLFRESTSLTESHNVVHIYIIVKLHFHNLCLRNEVEQLLQSNDCSFNKKAKHAQACLYCNCLTHFPYSLSDVWHSHRNKQKHFFSEIWVMFLTVRFLWDQGKSNILKDL